MRKTSLPRFEKLVKLYYQPLFRFATRLYGSSKAARAHTYDTLRRALDRSRELPVPANTQAWLFAVLFHDFLEHRSHA